MKTIKQVADSIGASKQAVYKRVRGSLHTDIAPYLHTVDGVLYVDEAGEAVISKVFEKTAPHTQGAYGSADAPHTTDTPPDVVQALIGQLDAKDKLISEQQTSIRELTAALENTTASLHAAQALHAGTMQKQLVAPGDDEPQRPGFWVRLFGKK